MFFRLLQLVVFFCVLAALSATGRPNKMAKDASSHFSKLVGTSSGSSFSSLTSSTEEPVISQPCGVLDSLCFAGFLDPQVGANKRCSHCGHYFDKSMVLITLDDPAMDWQGVIPLSCFLCSSLAHRKGVRDKKQWSSKCNSSWSARQKNSADHYAARVRCTSFEQVVEDVGSRHPGVGKDEYRKTLLDATLNIALQVMKAFRNLSEELRGTVLAAFASWDRDHEMRARDAEYVPQLVDVTLSDHVMQFVDEVVPGVHDYFLCRHLDCLHAIPGADWVRNVRVTRYLCPACGRQYRPWKRQPGCALANKVFVCEGDGGSALAFYPVVWPATPEQQLVNVVKRVTLGIDSELNALAPADRLDFVLAQLSLQRMPACMSQMALSDTVKLRILQLNLEKGAADTWVYSHIEHSGYNCFRLQNYDQSQVLKQEDVIRIWGLSKWLSHQTSARDSSRL